MSFGNLAAVLAQGMRGKRLGEQEARERDRQLVADYRAGEDRQAERDWRKAQAERQAAQDAREAAASPLEMELLRTRVEDARHQAAGTGRHAPTPVRRPWEAEGFGSAEEQAAYKRTIAQATREPRQAPEVNWEPVQGPDGAMYHLNPRTGQTRPITLPDGTPLPAPSGSAPRTLNAVQDAAGDYVARFAEIDDPTERARLGYQAFLQSGGRPRPGENPDHIWTAFLAASNRMAGVGGRSRAGSLEALEQALVAPRSENRGAGATPTLRPGTSRADRWEELVNAGLSEEAATTQVRREMPDE